MSANGLSSVIHTVAGLKRSAGGTSIAVTETCSELAKSGLQVNLVSQEFGSEKDGNVLPEHASVRVSFAKAGRLPFAGPVYSTSLGALVERICRASNSEVVHDHGLWLPANHAVAAACRKLRLPLIVSTHGMLSPHALNQDPIKKAIAWRIFQRRNLRSANGVCVTSVREADDVRAKGYDGPIAIIPHGVMLPEQRSDAANGSGIRTALYLGRIHPLKGLLALVEAWARVRPEGWRVTVAGPDEDGYERTVREAVARAGLEDVFMFVGPAYGRAKAALFEEASLFLLPSWSENFGMAIAEALAHGVPVITTTGTPWSSIARAGCGWWVDLGGGELAGAIREATAASVSDLRLMGSRGREMVSENFEWSRIAAMLIAFYGWVLGRAPRPEFVVRA